MRRTILAFAVAALCATGAHAQNAEALFSSKHTAASGPAESVGFYSRGCLSGAAQLPANGPHWQAMRPERDRQWGHPATIAFLERLSREAATRDVWPGLLVGDISQARGGPLPWGHSSHQVGLDADIWLRPMPEPRLSEARRNEYPFRSVLKEGTHRVDETIWTDHYRDLIKLAAEDPQVQRIFVHPGIKKKLCDTAGADRGWLNKVRPYWGHHEHFHVRLFCQDGSADCEAQKSTGTGDGCGAPLTWWFEEGLAPPDYVAPPREPDPPMQMSALPDRCRIVAQASEAAGPGTRLDETATRFTTFAPPANVPVPGERPAPQS